MIFGEKSLNTVFPQILTLVKGVPTNSFELYMYTVPWPD